MSRRGQLSNEVGRRRIDPVQVLEAHHRRGSRTVDEVAQHVEEMRAERLEVGGLVGWDEVVQLAQGCHRALVARDGPLDHRRSLAATASAGSRSSMPAAPFSRSMIGAYGMLAVYG